MKQILIEDDDLRWQSERHPASVNALDKAFQERDSARGLAARLEQELAEVQRRCMALASDWMASGSTYHAAQLAEALELGAEL